MRFWAMAPAAVCAAILCTSSIGLANSDMQAGNDRAELAWALGVNQYLHFTVADQKKLDPRAPLQGEDKQVEPAGQWVGFFGYEISSAGEWLRRYEPLILDEALMQLAMYLPAGKQKVGATWQREWKFEKVQTFNNFSVNSSYELKPQVEYNGLNCWLIYGKHSLKAHDAAGLAQLSRLTTFEADTLAYFDMPRGWLRGARVILRGSLITPAVGDKPGPMNYYDWDVEWRMTRDFDAWEEKVLNGRVERAIALGVERLWKQRSAEGLWPYGNHTRGGTALSLLALLMCDVPADDERIVESFRKLKDLPLDCIYDVGVSLMALEARYITVEERRSFLSSDKPVTLKRDLSPEDRAEMERLVAWIVANRNDTNPFWNYKKEPPVAPATTQRFDFSCTQYAILGLAAAQRCNVRIPPGITKKFVDETLKMQAANGPKVRRVISFTPPKDAQRGKGKSTYSTKTVEARGFHYSVKATWDKYQDTTTAYGSMSASGVTILMVGLEIADGMNEADFKAEFTSKALFQQWEKTVQDAIECGLAWHEYWFSVTRNPVYWRNWYYYYMYGLERVGMLAAIKFMGEHNWYYEGCCPLLALQDKDGGWGGATDTSFALLFLKKGTVPPRKKVFTGDK
ncbi:MAG: hypothetical protein HS108_12725 [Planctomycetes bacterium]|nr:hypothetical protein [Planctomycetota bacterium]MCL4731731.1 hypothetical protein [Planctomycetota bacterium]